MILEGLSSICAKLELASSQNKGMLAINVQQKFTSHALYVKLFIIDKVFLAISPLEESIVAKI